jgi:hypothetical protein
MASAEGSEVVWRSLVQGCDLSCSDTAEIVFLVAIYSACFAVPGLDTL